MKGTGNRGVQIYPRGQKFRDKYDSIFRPEIRSKLNPENNKKKRKKS
jgi:hypothetical protein